MRTRKIFTYMGIICVLTRTLFVIDTQSLKIKSHTSVFFRSLTSRFNNWVYVIKEAAKRGIESFNLSYVFFRKVLLTVGSHNDITLLCHLISLLSL